MEPSPQDAETLGPRQSRARPSGYPARKRELDETGIGILKREEIGTQYRSQ